MKRLILLLFLFIGNTSISLLAADAPVTMAGNVPNAIPGAPSVTIPVTVNGFTNIGQFTLTLTFDTTLVKYVSSITNPILTGMGVTYSRSSENTLGKLVLIWTGGANVSLADGSSISTLIFSYITGTGLLRWTYSSGSTCQYWRYVSGTLTTLNDSLRYQFYKNGGIANRGAPVTFAPSITVTGTGSLPVPVIVNDFTGIGALTLNLEYDPAIMTYVNFSKNAAFGSAFVAGSVPGNGGKMLIVIHWYGNPVTLSNGATLCTLNFNYTAMNSPGTTLNWFDNGPSCQYTDGPGFVLIDLPENDYYHDGIAAPPIVSVSISPSANPVCAGTPVTFTAVTSNGGTSPSYQWKVNSINAGTNSSAYTYVPANNDAITCIVTSNGAFVGGNPATSNQVGMSVIPAVSADFIASKLTPRKNDTVQLTDLSTGSPTAWNWSFDRPTVVFLNGTSLYSQNPQVEFTDGGLYTITLVANSSCGNNTKIKTGYIRAGIHGLWSGMTSSDWNTLSNWDNYLVPDSNTDVTIPPAAPNWPVFDGDLTLGVQCSHLTLVVQPAV